MKKEITVKEVSLIEKKGDKIMNLNKLTKAQLIELLEQKEKKTSGFNIWNYTYKNIVDSFIKNGEQTEFSFNVKRLDDTEFTNDKGETVKLEGARKVLGYLNKIGALKVTSYSEDFTEDGKRVYRVQVRDFNINVEKETKQGNKYKLFANYYGNLKLA